MPAFASLFINDGQTTPVSHNFNPGLLNQASATEVVAQYDDAAGNGGTNPLGYNSLLIGFKRPSPASQPGQGSTKERVFRLTVDFALPTLESTSAATGTGIPPVPTVAYISRSKQTFWLPERSSLQSRKDLLAFNRNVLATGSTVESMILNLQAIY